MPPTSSNPSPADAAPPLDMATLASICRAQRSTVDSRRSGLARLAANPPPAQPSTAEANWRNALEEMESCLQAMKEDAAAWEE